MKIRIFPIIALGIILIVIIPLIIMTCKKDVRGTYHASDEESVELSTLRQQAVTQYKANRFDKAIYYYEEALKLRPDNAVIHNDLGSAYLGLGKKAAGPMWPNWESDLTDMPMQSVIDEVEFALSDTDSGFIVFKAKDKNVINKIAELARKSGCWTHNEGNTINIMKGKTMEALLKAEEHFLQATIIKSNYAVAYRNIGALYIDIGKRQEGLKTLRYALKLNPSDEELRTYFEANNLSIEQFE